MPNLKNSRLASLVILLTILCYSCGEKDTHKNMDVDVDGKSLEVLRFDQDLFATNFTDPSAAKQALSAKYGAFLCEYVEMILNAGPCDSVSTYKALGSFTSLADYRDLESEIQANFTQERIDSITSALVVSIARLQHALPQVKWPKVYYMNSGFNLSSYCKDDYVAIGLDFFLGQQNKFTQMVPFPNYQKEDMTLQQLVPSTMKNMSYYYLLNTDTVSRSNDMLAEMVFHGKAMYATWLSFEEITNEQLMGWTPEQVRWAEAHTLQIWKEVAKQEVLFSKNRIEIKKWFDVGPFTHVGNVPQESPPQLGIWMGFLMVKSYMEKNPEISVDRLFHETNNQKILQAYKPEL